MYPYIYIYIYIHTQYATLYVNRILALVVVVVVGRRRRELGLEVPVLGQYSKNNNDNKVLVITAH